MRWGTTLVLLVCSASPTASLAQRPTFSLDAEPIAVLGGTVGEEFGFVLDAARLSGGGYVVLDQLSQDIRRFTPTGRAAGVIGRSGQGPLEFTGLLSVDVRADTIFVVDPGNRRVSVLDEQGTLLREIRLEVPFVVGEARRTNDARWLLRRQDLFTFGPRKAFTRDTVDYFVVGESMRDPRRVAHVPGVMAVSWSTERGTFDRVAPFSPRPKAAARGRCVYVTSTDEAAVRLFTSDGRSIGTFPWKEDPRVVTDSVKGVFVDMLLSRLPPGRERQVARAQAMRDLPVPATLPLTQSIVVDPMGFVWLQQFEPTYHGRTYRVLDPSLADLGQVSFPVDMRVLDVGADYVIGLVYGAHDEQTVQVYALERHGEPPPAPEACRE